MKLTSVSARWLALGALLAMALTPALRADTVTVDYGISLNGLNGSGDFTYDPTMTANDGPAPGGPYADGNNGLDSFNLTYDGITYTMGEALNAPIVPTVFLPGNPSVPAGLQYGFFALWVLNGTGSCTSNNTTPYSASCTGSDAGNTATILGLGRTSANGPLEAFLAENVGTVTISYSGTYEHYNMGPPGIQVIAGSITGEFVTPEPAMLPLLGLCFAGLWFARRRVTA